MTFSRIVFISCLAFLAGIFLASFLGVPKIWIAMLLFAGVGFGFAGFFYQSRRNFAIGFLLVFFAFGVWRFQSFWQNTRNQDISHFFGLEQILVSGKVCQEPDFSGKISRLEFCVSEINGQKANGKIMGTLGRFPEYGFGDNLVVTGKLEIPRKQEEFDYPAFLAKKGIFFEMKWPETEKTGKSVSFRGFFLKIKRQIIQQTSKIMPHPHQAFLEALVFGEEENLSADWKEKLNVSGTRHIAAVSGTNITIISFIIFAVLLKMGFWRQQAFYISAILIFSYVLMIGAPPSAVRAGVMGFLILLAQYFGRLSSGLRAAVFAGFLMALISPNLPAFDLGFQLSFLAVIGLIFFQPKLKKKLAFLPDFAILPCKTALSATIAAQVMVLPLLMFSFGRVSLVSLMSNVAIASLISPLTIILIMFCLAAWIFLPVAWLLLPLGWLGLEVLIRSVDFFSSFPIAVVLLKINFLAAMLLYLTIVGFIFWMKKKEKENFLMPKNSSKFKAQS